MSAPLDYLPELKSMLGIDLKTASMMIAALSVVHPVAYGCTLFRPLSYIIVTIWVLVSLFFAASVALFFGLLENDSLLCTVWIWYSLVFVAVMLVMMILLTISYTSIGQNTAVFMSLFGFLWYILTIYFIFVVNSYRKTIKVDLPLSMTKLYWLEDS